jgi:uncharacterized protein (TIGR03790 family)
MRIKSLLTLLFFIGALATNALASGMLLVNTQVPVGKEIAQQYAELHQLKDLKVVEISVDPLESISWAEYKSKVEVPLRLAIGEAWPDWLLTIYGVPVMVEGTGRIRSLDQCLALMRYSEDLQDKLALNPHFFKEASDKFIPLRVCRLDAPALKHVQSILESWAQLRNWGHYRRCFPMDAKGKFSEMLNIKGLWTHPISDFTSARLDEVQLLESQDDDLALLLASRSPQEIFAPGAIVIRHHNKAQKDTPFRSNKGNASRALAHGAGVYIGALGPKATEEDLFDPELFASLYLKGKSFVDSVYAATPILGGSLLICGDPLAEPFSQTGEALHESSFMTAQQNDKDPLFVQKLARARDWWMIHDYLSHWEKGQFSMVVELLKIAIQRRPEPVYCELLARSYLELGRQEELQSLWNTWPEDKKGDWEKYLWTEYWMKRSE